ncbi:MAG: hypothetical protein J4F36_12970 [Nitrosopumilaceae archaeon]|nr:hypothetical protein [Nitrosopumilaceae archaeon]
MNKVIIAGIAVTIAIIGIYFTVFQVNDEKIIKDRFLEITDYKIIQDQSAPLFLSVIVSKEIPKTLDTNISGYGFAWFEEKDGTLQGYATNIHSESKWHTESIKINDAKQFCFDNAELIISNVMIEQNQVKVIVEKSDSTEFDRVISYHIIEDNSCHLGFAGRVIDEYKIT